MSFVNRYQELSDLESLWTREGGQMAVIYARRRTGKTTLLSKFLEGKPSLFWVADRFPSKTLLGTFSRAIYSYQHPDIEVAPDFQYASWEMAFQTLGSLAKNQRIGVVLDELPYAQVGSYWDRDTQVDVVGMNWREQTMLLGGACWTSRPISIQALDALQAKTPAVLPQTDWHVHYVLFSRSGFTKDIQNRAEAEDILLVDWATILATLQ